MPLIDRVLSAPACAWRRILCSALGKMIDVPAPLPSGYRKGTFMATPNSIKIDDHTLELGREYPPPNETETIEKLRVLLQLVHKSQASGAAQRGQHPKQHGGVWATFRVLTDIPDKMRVGIFSESRSFTA